MIVIITAVSAAKDATMIAITLVIIFVISSINLEIKRNVRQRMR